MIKAATHTLAPGEELALVGSVDVALAEGSDDAVCEVDGYRLVPGRAVRICCSVDSAVPVVRNAGADAPVELRVTEVSERGIAYHRSLALVQPSAAAAEAPPAAFHGLESCTAAAETQQRVVQPLAWTAAIEQCVESARNPRIMVVGPRNSGKSTLARLLINTLLNQRPAGVQLLDTDVGQPECTAVGLVSLHRITAPLLGPSFGHVRKPQAAFFLGETSPKHAAGAYQHAVAELAQRVDPTNAVVINTCGWVTGMGQQLLDQMVRAVQPTHILSLAVDVSLPSTPPTTVRHVLHRAELPRSAPSLGAADVRMRQMLAALGHSVERPIDSRSGIPVPFAQIGVVMCGEAIPHGELLPVLNLSFVALAHDERVAAHIAAHRATLEAAPVPMLLDGAPLLPIQGIGIVRGIDAARKALYIISSLPPAAIAKCNVVIVGRWTGGLGVSPALYEIGSSTGPAPYLVSHALASVVHAPKDAGLGKRREVKRRKVA